MTQCAQMRLPIDDLLPEIIDSLRRTPNLVVEAAPGAGKTTRIPPALLKITSGEVLVLEPRRIAARMSARRVAEELGEDVGQTVGYQVRFENVSSRQTRLRFITEGVLTRRLLSDPFLHGVEIVLLDEFHERHLDSDLALALLRRLQQRRPELRIVVMSATLDAAPIAAFLGGCPIVRSVGRSYPLAIKHRSYSSLPLERQVRVELEALLPQERAGHVLVFLPGAAEIHRCIRECEGVARNAGALLLPLHGSLSPADQDRAVASTTQRKILMSTNVAESSLTIDGVTIVIDSGLARIAAYSPWSGMPTLAVGRVSKASATQRAGRAGRTGPGRVFRLYAQEDYLQRPDHDVPEILRSDLTGLCLALRAMGFARADELEWVDAPTEAAAAHANDLLDRLGASTESAAKELARLPLSPRLARMVAEAVRRGVGDDAVALAAIIGSGQSLTSVDLLSALDAPMSAQSLQQRRQLERLLPRTAQRNHDENSLLQAVLAGFPDRVARLRSQKQVTLSSKISAEFSGEPPGYEYMVVTDAEERSEKQLPVVRATARIEPEWLLDQFPDRIHEDVSVEWNRFARRVDAVSTMRYDALVLTESTNTRPDPEQAADLLARMVLETGLEQFIDASALQEMLARMQFAGRPEPDLPQQVRELCTGLRSFAEFREAAQHLLSELEREAGQELRDTAPSQLRLASGRMTKVHYESGKAPWIASRLQDFFGTRETPRIGRTKTPVVVHLLAPNHRAVQVTTDLAGFWERLYPQVRRELMRRYPRHAWPERP